MGGQVHLQRVSAQDLGVGEGHEIDRGQCCRRLVTLDGENRQVQAGQRHGVPTDAAAQVRHAAHSCLGIAGSVVGGHGQARGLLQAVWGKEHLGGEGTELGRGALAQALLGQGCRDQLRAVAGLAQLLAQAQGGVRVVRRQ